MSSCPDQRQAIGGNASRPRPVWGSPKSRPLSDNPAALSPKLDLLRHSRARCHPKGFIVLMSWCPHVLMQEYHFEPTPWSSWSGDFSNRIADKFLNASKKRVPFIVFQSWENLKLSLGWDTIWFEWMNTLRSDYVWEDRHPIPINYIFPLLSTHTALKKREAYVWEHIWVLTSQVKPSNVVLQLLQLEHKSTAFSDITPEEYIDDKSLIGWQTHKKPAVTLEFPTELHTWDSFILVSIETFLLVSIETDYQSGCSRFRMLFWFWSAAQARSSIIGFWIF